MTVRSNLCLVFFVLSGLVFVTAIAAIAGLTSYCIGPADINVSWPLRTLVGAAVMYAVGSVTLMARGY